MIESRLDFTSSAPEHHHTALHNQTPSLQNIIGRFVVQLSFQECFWLNFYRFIMRLKYCANRKSWGNSSYCFILELAHSAGWAWRCFDWKQHSAFPWFALNDCFCVCIKLSYFPKWTAFTAKLGVYCHRLCILCAPPETDYNQMMKRFAINHPSYRLSNVIASKRNSLREWKLLGAIKTKNKANYSKSSSAHLIKNQLIINLFFRKSSRALLRAPYRRAIYIDWLLLSAREVL